MEIDFCLPPRITAFEKRPTMTRTTKYRDKDTSKESDKSDDDESTNKSGYWSEDSNVTNSLKSCDDADNVVMESKLSDCCGQYNS